MIDNTAVDNTLNATNFLEDVLSSPLEGSVSQNFDLGPGYFFMLCRTFVKVFCHSLLRFTL